MACGHSDPLILIKGPHYFLKFKLKRNVYETFAEWHVINLYSYVNITKVVFIFIIFLSDNFF